MYRLHCTQKLLSRLHIAPAEAMSPSTTILDSWYATMLFWKPQLALLINEKTLLPVLCPLAPAATLQSRFPYELSRVLLAAGIDHAWIARERAMMNDCVIAKTKNRSVVGMLNEFAFLARAYRDDLAIIDPLALSLRLADTPCGPLKGQRPRRLLHDYFQQTALPLDAK